MCCPFFAILLKASHSNIDQPIYLSNFKLSHMNYSKPISLISLCGLITVTACMEQGKSTENGKANDSSITINPKDMKYIGSVDERYQSYNVEMAEVVGGAFWKPYHLMDSLPSAETTSNYDISQRNENMYRKLPPVNLADNRLLTLAKGLAPAYVRVSGTWANATYFQDNDEPKMAKAPAGFVNVLTRKEWKGVIDFIRATKSELVTSFAVSKGVRDAQGVWTPEEAQKLVDYTKRIGGKIAAAELFNEPNLPASGGEMGMDYNAQSFARDVAVFSTWAKSSLPDMLTVGPGTIGEGIPGVSFPLSEEYLLSTTAMMSAEPKPVFDIFSYHYYGAASIRMMQSGPFSIKADSALAYSWLHKTDQVAEYFIDLRNKYNPGKPVWLTETAQAAAGGDPFAATYLDCFRYLYQLGSLAKKGIKMIMHNTLAASEYSLIDPETHLPKPNYWSALLWARLMGTEVYEVGSGEPGVYLFAHNMKGREGGITVLVINTNPRSTHMHTPTEAQQYLLTSKELLGTTVELNGVKLRLTENDELPALNGQSVKAGNISLPPHSICFLTFAQAGNNNVLKH